MEPTDVFSHNHMTLLSLARGTRYSTEPERRMGILLERIVMDNATGDLVPYDGKAGIGALLAHMASTIPGAVADCQDGRAMGLTYPIPALSAPLKATVSLGAGAQLICGVGQTSHIIELLHALEDLDRRIHVAARDMGMDYVLIAEGYNPLVDSPLDVSLVPRTQWTLLNAFLGQTGRYSRDAMRCGCSTTILLERGEATHTIGEYQLAVALTPLIMFLTDNVRSFRGSGARRCPRMVRSMLWDEIDPARCGIVPGTFGKEFSYESYVRWLEGINPIMIAQADRSVISSGKKTLAELMEEREFSVDEASALAQGVFPYVRLGRAIEFLQADSLRPSMACGYAAFVKGLFCNSLSVDAARSLIGDVTEADVADALHRLRTQGWDATLYGRDVIALSTDLLQIARSALDDAGERRLLDNIAELWEVYMVPRDTFVHQEEKAVRGW